MIYCSTKKLYPVLLPPLPGDRPPISSTNWQELRSDVLWVLIWQILGCLFCWYGSDAQTLDGHTKTHTEHNQVRGIFISRFFLFVFSSLVALWRNFGVGSQYFFCYLLVHIFITTESSNICTYHTIQLVSASTYAVCQCCSHQVQERKTVWVVRKYPLKAKLHVYPKLTT